MSNIKKLDWFWRSEGGAWSPSNISSAVAWWDANDLTTITKDGGDAVSSWVDKISSYDAVEGTGTKQPIWTASQLNGKPSIVFDGVNDELNSAAITQIKNVQECTFIMVGKSGEIVNWTSSTRRTQLSAANSGSLIDVGIISINPPTSFGTVAAANVFGNLRLEFNGTLVGNVNRLKLFRDNIQSVLAFTNSIPANTDPNPTSFRMGNQVTVWNPLEVCEIIICNELLSPSEVTSLNAYINTKYGL